MRVRANTFFQTSNIILDSWKAFRPWVSEEESGSVLNSLFVFPVHSSPHVILSRITKTNPLPRSPTNSVFRTYWKFSSPDLKWPLGAPGIAKHSPFLAFYKDIAVLQPPRCLRLLWGTFSHFPEFGLLSLLPALARTKSWWFYLLHAFQLLTLLVLP